MSLVLKIGPVIVRDTVHEFFAQIDPYAKASNWSEKEKALIANAKLQGIALQYVQGRDVLAHDACPYSVVMLRIAVLCLLISGGNDVRMWRRT